jgi:hypothetical protein
MAMNDSSYLHLKIPGRGRLTLSYAGVSRALRAGKLPLTAEAWLESVEVWLPLDRHPIVSALSRVRTLSDDLEMVPDQSGELSSSGHDITTASRETERWASAR